jgi:hypothetical protein
MRLGTKNNYSVLSLKCNIIVTVEKTKQFNVFIMLSEVQQNLEVWSLKAEVKWTAEHSRHSVDRKFKQ